MRKPLDPEIKSMREEWRAEERKKAKAEKIAEASLPSLAYDSADAEEAVEAAEAQNDWERLKTIAKLKFPDHLAMKFKLRSEERLAAIAVAIGWTVERIALASNRNTTTVYRWLNKEEAQEFIKAFEYHNGTQDAKELIDREQYQSLQVLKDLRDDPTTSASTRKEIAIWFFEAKYGKAKDRKEVTTVNLRDLTEAIRKTTAEDVANIFDDIEEDGKHN